MQLTLGKLINALERAPQDTPVVFDFCHFAPSNFSCYRGYYDQLALSYAPAHILNHPTVAILLESAKKADGESYTGWKGGEYRMNRSTPIWVAEDYGDYSQTAIIDTREENGYFVLETNFEP